MTEQSTRYARQVALPEVGVEGQKRLQAGRVLVIGAGGLGCPALQYVAAAGVGTIGIIDFDQVDLSNLQRQILFTEADVGQPKAEIAARRLRALTSDVRVTAMIERFEPANAERLCAEYDVIIDGSDNFATRYLVNDACVVTGRPFIAASVLRFHGQIGAFHVPLSPRTRSATYRCLFPEPPDPAGAPRCSVVGVIGAVPGIFGAMQAEQTVQLLLGRVPSLAGRLLSLDLLTGRADVVTIACDPATIAAAHVRTVEEYQGVCMAEAVVQEIAPRELRAKLDQHAPLTLIDVREAFEREICSLGGALIPLQTLPDRIAEIPRDHTVVVYCRSGGRSAQAVEYLQREHRFTNLLNLAGGVLRWSDEVDSSVKKY